MRFLHNLKKKFIGDRQFYLYVCSIAIPMILQNMVTNFVSLLDNIMVGQRNHADERCCDCQSVHLCV